MARPGGSILARGRRGTRRSLCSLALACGLLGAAASLAAAYDTPLSASRIDVPLVPAFKECRSPNATHGAPLSQPSCYPAAKKSSALTIGSPDVLGRADPLAVARYDVRPGNPGTPEDEADVGLGVVVTDVRKSSDLLDYVGQLDTSAVVRVTDANTAQDGATTIDFRLRVPFSCTATVDLDIGALCSLRTAVDSVLPGAVKEGDKAVWQMDEIEVREPGSGQHTGMPCAPTCQTSAGAVLLAQGVSVPTREEAPAGDPVIAAAGDIACNPRSPSFNRWIGSTSSCRQVLTSDLLDENLAAVLPLGDLQYEAGEGANFEESYDIGWGRFKEITKPVLGNHEYATSGATGFFDYFNGKGHANGPAGERGKGYYSYDIGAWHLIALNSNCSRVGGCGAGSPQETWLREDLAAHPNMCTLAYWHHPRFSSGKYGNFASMQPFWAALAEAGAEIVLSGHSHNYERFLPMDASGVKSRFGGLRQWVVGTGGKSHYSWGAIQPNSKVRDSTSFGVLELTLHPDSYDWRFVPIAGSTFTDEGSLPCHGPEPPAP